MAITVRRAESEDIAGIQSVGLLTWPATYLPFTSPEFVLANLNSWWSEDAVRSSVEEDTTFVACEGESILGTLTLGEFEGEAVIWKIYVLPALQGTADWPGLDEPRTWACGGNRRRPPRIC